MTSTEIRQSFLDFFKSKGHTIVPSSSLLPYSPNRLFTNAGINQFVPIFLGQRAPDVSKWPGAIPPSPNSHLPSSTGDTRAADTQKCIRAGGKHNDLEDVGLDTYHHTFFEMLGNWSFGDYFKMEAIEWAWELVVGRWNFPAKRLYATVYKPGPGEPCSEIHVDLTPEGDTKGSLVNKGDARCIEIWNLVFIQFNANPDGSFSPLPAKHVDTGMGFERVTGIIQNTNGFKDFSRIISNYETDIFRPLFNKIEELSGKKYKSTLPPAASTGNTEQEKIDVAFRVIADHIRTLSFSIADGIIPSNEGRGYVLRRILRRAVRYGRSLGFHEPFFYKLVATLAENMGQVFPEIRAKRDQIEEVIQREEKAFNNTLDNGLVVFNEVLQFLDLLDKGVKQVESDVATPGSIHFTHQSGPVWKGLRQTSRATTTLFGTNDQQEFFHAAHALAEWFDGIQGGKSTSVNESEALVRKIRSAIQLAKPVIRVISGPAAFLLYDTYGFPLESRS